MGATLQSGPGRLAVGAVVGALTAALFTTGIMNGAASQDPREQGAAVEPIPPGQRPSRGTVTLTTDPTSATSTPTSTTTGTSTTTTTTTSADDDPPPVTTTTTTTTRHTPPPVTTTRTTTTTTCSSLICVG